MKRVVFLFLLSVSIFSKLYSIDDVSSIDLAIDLSYIDPFIDNVIYNEITPSINIYDDLSIRLPINFIIPTDNNLDILGIGYSIDVLYRPFFNNIYISFSLIKVEHLFGLDAPYENLQYLNKLSLGYSYFYNDKIFIEPAISFINLNGIYDESISTLKDSFEGFPTTRFSLIVGYRIINIYAKKEK